jgi:hypothetical protein
MEKGDTLIPNCKDGLVVRGADVLLEKQTVSLLYRMYYVYIYRERGGDFS